MVIGQAYRFNEVEVGSESRVLDGATAASDRVCCNEVGPEHADGG